MNKSFSSLLVVVSLFAFAPRIIAGDARAELQELINKINAKLQTGKHAEQDFKVELGEFDKLLAEHTGEKTDDVARILAMKANLYAEVFDDDDKAIQLLNSLRAGFPETLPGKEVDMMIAAIEKEQPLKKIQRSLAVGTQFPDFDEKDLDGKPLSVAKYKGKIVMIDFWATWCPPCLRELPNVLQTYNKYHDKGFEIIGVSSDDDKDLLTGFIKEKKMVWPQYFDTNGPQNKLAVKYGIITIPATYLLDRDGKIIAKNLRGEELADAVSKAVAAH